MEKAGQVQQGLAEVTISNNWSVFSSSSFLFIGVSLVQLTNGDLHQRHMSKKIITVENLDSPPILGLARRADRVGTIAAKPGRA